MVRVRRASLARVSCCQKKTEWMQNGCRVKRAGSMASSLPTVLLLLLSLFRNPAMIVVQPRGQMYRSASRALGSLQVRLRRLVATWNGCLGMRQLGPEQSASCAGMRFALLLVLATRSFDCAG